MIEERTVLGLIPARGGSKGLPGKNTLPFGDKPLIVHTINQANKSKYIDRLVLSSEDKDIIKVVKKYNVDVPFVRPQYLAKDSTSGLDVVLHAIKKISGYDIVVLLQPTSPLRISKDIDRCIEKLIYRQVNACVSVTESSKNPNWMFQLSEDDKFIPVVSDQPLVTIRQDLPKTYTINGAVYVAKIKWFIQKKVFINDETLAHIMPLERSIDIDSKYDFMFAELLYTLK